MKLLTSWVADPCVHLLAVGLLIAYFAIGANAEPQSKGDEGIVCQNCQKSHGEVESCPLPIPPGTVSLAAH